MFLDAAALDALLRDAGVPTVAQQLVTDEAGALGAADSIGYPVVLKLTSPTLVHKSDVGGVLIGLRDGGAVREGFRRLAALAAALELRSWSVVVAELVPAGEIEMFVGVMRDPTFGPVILVGAGGRLVELLDDIAVRRCPVDEDEALALLGETRIGAATAGYRGFAADRRGLAATVSALSRLAASRADLAAVDLNPVVPRAGGDWVTLDARAVLAPAPADPAEPPVAQASTRVRALLEARSVLLLGVSATDPGKPGNRVLAYLRRNGYAGTIHLVHPSAAQIEGVPAVASVEALPDGGIDLACIAIPAAACAGALASCGRKGVRTALVMTSGFAEAGNLAGEAELLAIAEEYGIGLCGPNTIGVISPAIGLHACFSLAQEVERPIAGAVAILAQSGALGGSLLSQAWERNLGVSHFVSVGNQAQLRIADFLHYLAEDEATGVVAVLLESAPDGGALVAALLALREREKPVVLLKVGRSAVGNAAAQSHTGALAGDARVYDAVFRELGVSLTTTPTELLDGVAALSRQPRARGRRVGVVSTSGGACALVADLCTDRALEIPELSREDGERLAEVLPAFVKPGNPVDTSAQVLADPDILSGAVRILLASERIDLVIVAITTVTGADARRLAAGLIEACQGTRVPVIVAWTIAERLAREGVGLLEAAGLAVYPALERAVAAAAVLAPASPTGAGVGAAR